MEFLFGQTIRRQLMAATVALLLPIAAAIAWASTYTFAERQDEVKDQAASMAVMAAAQLEEYLAGLDAMASAVVRHPVVMALERHKADQLFADLIENHPLVTNLVLTSPGGHVLAAGTPWPEALDKVAWRNIAEVVRSKQPYVGNFATSPLTGKSVVALGYPVRDESGTVVGVLTVGIDLIGLQTVFASIPLPEGSVVKVTDRENRVIARSRDADAFIGKQIAPAVNPDAELRGSLRTDLDGVERLSADASVRHGAWTLTAGIPAGIVFERLRPMYRRNLAVMAGAFVALITLGLVLAWQTELHLHRLRSAAERMAGGDLSPIHRIQTPNLEFAQLQDTFITMATKLRGARDALDHQMEQERNMNETLQSLQRQVVRQERLTAVGLLVSGVAHEVNNPLQAIVGTVELIERNPSTPSELRDDLVFLKTQGSRAQEIIRKLSRFSGQQSGPPSLVDLRDVVREVVQLRRRDLDAAGISLDVQARTGRKVHVNFTEIEQVALNFVINAQQAIESAGAQKRIAIHLFDVGRLVRLEVRDDGPGVKPEDEPKLFQPFFTTKPVGMGTGLGLSVSYGIIDSYGGTIGYTGNEWGGATFFFELPAGEAESDHDLEFSQPS